MMELIEKEQLKVEIAHIFESGANEIRIFEMVKYFIDRRNGVNKLPIHDVIGQSGLWQPPCHECDSKGCIKCAGSGYVIDEPLP